TGGEFLEINLRIGGERTAADVERVEDLQAIVDRTELSGDKLERGGEGAVDQQGAALDDDLAVPCEHGGIGDCGIGLQLQRAACGDGDGRPCVEGGASGQNQHAFGNGEGATLVIEGRGGKTGVTG